jgi:hypothetical protein
MTFILLWLLTSVILLPGGRAASRPSLPVILVPVILLAGRIVRRELSPVVLLLLMMRWPIYVPVVMLVLILTCPLVVPTSLVLVMVSLVVPPQLDPRLVLLVLVIFYVITDLHVL